MTANIAWCRFTNALGGTVDFIHSGSATLFQGPTAAGAANGKRYRYYAESADLTKWEIGECIFTLATKTFARTLVLYNSAGTAPTKIAFTEGPEVSIVPIPDDYASLAGDNTFTGLNTFTQVITASGGVAAASTFDPTANDAGAYIASGGSYGGGVVLKDGAGRGGIWTTGSGATLNLDAGGTSSGFVSSVGTLQITATGATVNGTATVTGASTLTGGFSAGANSSVTGTLSVSSDFAVATNKFTVAAASGNTVVAGTLNLAGALTYGGVTFANLSTGSASSSLVGSISPTFTGTAAFANTTNSGTLGVIGLSTLTGGFSAGANSSVTGTLSVSSDFAVATNKFTVAAASGNGVLAGTFNLGGALTYGGVAFNNTSTGASGGSLVGSASPAFTGTATFVNTSNSGTLAVAGVISTTTPQTASGVLKLSGGDSAATYSNATIGLGYNNTNQYMHWVHTRHSAGTAAANGLDFYTSDGTAAGVFPTNGVFGLKIENGTVGIGANLVPDALLTVNAHTALTFAPEAGTNIHMVGAAATNNVLTMDSFAAQNVFRTRRANGTLASKTALVAGNVVLNLTATGWDTSIYANIAGFLVTAAQTFTSTLGGGYISVRTTAISASAAITETSRFHPSGAFTVGPTSVAATDPGVGNISLDGVVTSGNGTVSLPAYSFVSDPDSGMYRIGANNIGFAVNGAKVVDVGTAGAAITGTLSVSGTLTASGTLTSATFVTGNCAVQAPQASIALTSSTSTNTYISFANNSGAVNNYIYRNAATDFRVTSNAALTTGVKIADGAGAWADIASDRRVKPNFTEFSVLDKIEDFRAGRYRNSMSGRWDIGAIAQEQYKHWPEIVIPGTDDEDRAIVRGDDPGMWSLIYDRFGIIALQATKELNRKVDRKFRELEQRLAA